MARKHNVGEFRETKKVKDPSRLKRVGASAKQREAFLELKALDRSNKAEQGKLLFKFTFNEEKCNLMLLSLGEAEKKKRKPSVDESPAVVLKRLKASLENAADEANERGEPCPDQLMNLEEKLPRERETKTDTERSLIEAAHHEVITEAPATNTHYRARSSGYVREYNETYSDQLPMGLEFSFKTFRCVYSVYQEYRAKGDRSNNTGGDIPVDGEVARTDSLLADAKASTKDIGVFLSRQLGRQFTPQQTKNLLKRIGSNMSSHSRCFLTHSHRWKTLAMDWTHSTNNLGFHLVFVYDNRSHLLPTRIVAFEVLEDDLQCFGFFVHSHEVKYCPSEKDQVQRYFADMLYSSTAARFEDVYSDFAEFCSSSNRTDVKKYFDKNWKTCLPMWSNFERSKCFSAGNTTTNRIESNWMQLKMVLGKRTSIDKTVDALLQHQSHVIDQISYGIQSTLADCNDDFN
ncbi:hypothetical protein PC123_g8975 [Phytophthora cactorum]|nr:hypothetical protein PC123_g8975 [Phytophthora cactorum]